MARLMPRQHAGMSDRCQHAPMHDTPATRAFTARLGLQLPLIQAPMAGFQGAAIDATMSA